MTESAAWHGQMDLWRSNGVRPPMVPTFEDVTLMQRASAESLAKRSNPRVLVLGLTPAITMAPWLDGCEIKVVDYDKEMIDARWTWRSDNRAEAICADWSTLPFPDDHFDLVVGDGSFCALPNVERYPAVLSEIQRVKRAGASVVARFFMRPAVKLTFHDIVSGEGVLLRQDHEPSELNFLTIMAACNPDGTVHYNEIADKIRQQWGDPDLYIKAAWPDVKEATRTKSLFTLAQCVNFPTRTQIVEQFARHGLIGTAFTPSYRVGAYCPTIRFDG